MTGGKSVVESMALPVTEGAAGPGDDVAVLGVGRMGLPIALGLKTAIHTVRVFDTDSGASARARKAGLRVVDEVTALIRDARTIVTVLPGPVELRDAALCPNGFIASAHAGARWIDMTSNDPATTTMCAEAAAHRGIEYTAAPIRGGVGDAREGQLRFYLGGSRVATARARRILDALSGTNAIEEVGDDPTHASLVKLLANLLWFGQVAVTTEMLLLGQSQGLEPGHLTSLLRNSVGGSAYLDHHVDALLAGDYLDSFGIDRILDELHAVTDLAADAGIPVDTATRIVEVHEQARTEFGSVDGELLVARLLERRAGETLRSPPSPESTANT